MVKNNFLKKALLVSMMVTSTVSLAVAPPGEEAKIGSFYNPLGGEMSGNAKGTIPAWTGGMKKSAVVGDNAIPSDFLSEDSPLMKITAANMQEYADNLNPGVKALLEKHPDSFYLNVYPTRRTASAPDYVYSNTRENAKNCRILEGGESLAGCFGGIPFPIPQDGIELIWNYLLRVAPEAEEHGFKNILQLPNGTRTVATRNDNFWQYPYYYSDGNANDWSNEYFLQRFITTAPPFKSGESLVIRDSISAESPRRSWQYLLGQRRVRQAPAVGYDTPDFVSSGANYFDEVLGFFGMPDRYDWKIVGKQETYIPYNNNKLLTASEDEAFVAYHPNPDLIRWELHRTWVVEATVKEGKRHAVPKRVFYFDEDSWLLTQMDGYDSQGKLWRTSLNYPFAVPAIPALMVRMTSVFDLQAGTVSNVQSLNGEKYRLVPRKPESFYTGDAVAAESAR